MGSQRVRHDWATELNWTEESKEWWGGTYYISIYSPRLASLRTQICAYMLSHVQLFATMDYSLPGSSVCGIFETRILEWIAISYSRVSSWCRDQTCVSCISFIARLASLPLHHLGSPNSFRVCLKCRPKLRHPRSRPCQESPHLVTEQNRS